MSRLISYVIPCYGSEKTIRGVVEEIKKLYCGEHDDEYEIVLVNDSSPDNVWKVIEQLINENHNIKGVELAKNFGQHAALLAGYSYTKGDIVVSLDDDGQIAVEDTYKIINDMDNGYDVVYGKYKKKKHNIFRNMGTLMAKWMGIYLMSVPKEFDGSSFYAAKRYVVDEMIKYKNPYVFLPGLVFRTTNKVHSVYVGHRKREIGRSGYTFASLFALWLNGATTFSIKPLRVSAFLGFVTAVLGILFSIIVIVKKLLNPNIIMGWSSLIAVTLVLSGVILIVLGMMGEYVGRLYMSSNSEPQYVVRQISEDSTNTK